MTGSTIRCNEHTFARFVVAPENASALAAVQRVLACVCSQRTRRAVNPLFLHGPAGTGKSHLASALVTEVLLRKPDTVIAELPAGDWAVLARTVGEDQAEEAELLAAARRCDLLLVEDVQHLPARATEALVGIFDSLLARQRQMVFTAMVGPRHLTHLSARLTSRLASGLRVELGPLQAPGRLAYLQAQAQRRQVAVPHDVLAWLAEHLTGGGRQLDGAITKLAALARLHPRWLDVATVAEHFRDEVHAGRPTVERIVQRVGGYFRVEPRLLQSARRSRGIVLPRQVGMYLARRLTGLSLTQIGAYFGDRDHSTVLHACRKVEQALARDAALSGAVRQLQADLA
jgi:chromosomal replication initiator protein